MRNLWRNPGPAYTDHNPIEVRLAKGWVFRAVCRPVRKLKRPNWRLLRGSGEAAQTARAALSAELDRRVAESEPTSWSEVVDLGLGVARAVLGDEPSRDPRPWIRGLEGELQGFDQAVSQASSRKRKAETEDEFRGRFLCSSSMQTPTISMAAGEGGFVVGFPGPTGSR